MRIAMNTLMIAKWRALGSYQSRYVPSMIGPFLKVSLIPHTGKEPHPSPRVGINWNNDFTVILVDVC